MMQILPMPDENALAASRALVARICEEARCEGDSLTFERFMELALYAPGLGYYAGGSRKFGGGGDFVTAPEISPLFSRCLAVQVAEVLARLGGGVVLEFGAGSGVMAADVLIELAARNALPEKWLILEVSGELRERQASLLSETTPQHASRVQWLDRLPEEPFDGVIVANEVLDAFPVQRFRIGPEGIETGRVCCEGQVPAGCWGRSPPEVVEAVDVIRQEVALDDEYCSEVCLRLAPWVHAAGEVLGRGAMLLIDYGYPRAEYYHPDRSDGTLLCHYRHRAHSDALFLPGLQDITAHVDFTAVGLAALASGLEVAGFVTQAQFLLNCGLEGFLAKARAAGAVEGVKAAQQAKRLVLPTEMGERFKVMALTRRVSDDDSAPLVGFSNGDLRYRL